MTGNPQRDDGAAAHARLESLLDQRGARLCGSAASI